MMNDECLEDDLDFFVALDLSATESRAVESSSRISPTTTRGKRRVGVPKQRVGTFGEPSQGTRGSRSRHYMAMEGPRRFILAPTIGQRSKREI